MHKYFHTEYRTHISNFRKIRNLSQHQVAKEMGMLPNNFNEFENGKGGHMLEIRFFIKLAKVLGVSLEELAKAEAEYRDKLDKKNGYTSIYQFKPSNE